MDGYADLLEYTTNQGYLETRYLPTLEPNPKKPKYNSFQDVGGYANHMSLSPPNLDNQISARITSLAETNMSTVALVTTSPAEHITSDLVPSMSVQQSNSSHSQTLSKLQTEIDACSGTMHQIRKHDMNKQNSTNVLKLKWEKAMTVFPVREGETLVPKGRKCYDAPRRKEVGLTRIVGACNSCRLQRVQCDFYSPCDTCYKRAGREAMGRELCLRQTLVNTRMSGIGKVDKGIRVACYHTTIHSAIGSQMLRVYRDRSVTSRCA
ncbi:hypothetical protein B0J14DRAFT_375884 [Halenospora varia]|nr:hypothetical protein B0J14DRAFT_375884 [Halenospora varia]